MLFGAIRSIIRPVSRALINSRTTSSTPLFSASYNNELHSHFGSVHLFWRPASARLIQTLTDTRFPKRRPVDKPRRKRASLKPSGPYAWVKHVPGEPIPSNQPNVGSVKRRNEKKRIRLRKAFILAEKKKRKAQLQEANRKKKNAKIERQMAAVARDRAWAERLAELQQIEEDKKNAAGFVAAHTLPVVYEKYDDQINNTIYNVLGKLQNNKLDASVLSRILKANRKKFG